MRPGGKERKADFVRFAVDRPEVAGLHLAAAGATRFDRGLIHRLDTDQADRGKLCLVDRAKQADDALGGLRQGRLTVMPESASGWC
jgi:hypothetical protein